jgi:drug/metabolite transporter (DMT)-like permease
VKSHRAALAALLLISSMWGATFTLVKNVLADIAPEPYLFYRFTLGGAILLVIAANRGRLRRDVLVPGLILGSFVFAGYWSQTRGLILISPSRSAFLTGLSVVMVPFFDRLLRGTRITSQAWIGSVFAVAGTSVLMGGFTSRSSIGDLLTLVGAISFALHIVYSSTFTARHSPTGLAAIQVAAVGLFAGPPAFFASHRSIPANVVMVIVFTACVTTAFSFVAMMWAQSKVTATEAAVILAFEPVAAMLTSMLAGRETITASFLAGATLIVSAMIVSQIPGRSEKRLERRGTWDGMNDGS